MTERSAIRAPTEDGAVLAEPPLDQAGALLDANRQRRPGPALLGRPWAEQQQRARAALHSAALRYFAERGEPAPAVPANPALMILAGHQPELFHPGVWVKNFALAGLARRHSATALNLVVDNDTVKATALRLPAPPDGSPIPHFAKVPFDRWTGEAPWEERSVVDPALFESFADRALAVLAPWGLRPLLPAFWAEVRSRRQGPATPLGECFAGARRALERAWGCHNLEVPLSSVCRTEPFAEFAFHILSNLRDFHAIYNASVHAYRARHGIRSRNHPVPDLAEEDGWLEAPFWGWRPGQAQRGRLFARLLPDRIELRAGEEAWPLLSRNPTLGVQNWLALEERGLKARSRALTTTLYARLFLADLFLHGIGGGKYDELTDEIMRRFYSVESPAFMVLSATRWLPLPGAPGSPEDRRRLARQLRDLHYNPQRHLPPNHDLAGIVRRKEELIAEMPSDRRGRRERFQALRAVNEELRAPLTERELQLQAELHVLDLRLAGNTVLRRRDYAFCLYPEETLRPFCAQFL